jgi:hypothetical protein
MEWHLINPWLLFKQRRKLPYLAQKIEPSCAPVFLEALNRYDIDNGPSWGAIMG